MHLFRYEFLLFALLMVIFNKIFIPSQVFFTTYVWPANMILLGVSSFFIFNEQNIFIRILKNILFIAVTFVPIFASILFATEFGKWISLSAYLLFYIIIFIEVIRQVIKPSEVDASIILGSLSGYLLLVFIATFSFLLILLSNPMAFNGLHGTTIPELYYQMTYFSVITLASIGFGDITPAAENARLLTAFWGIFGQFYMVTLVGILISKFSSNKNTK